jgi:hypothetical protein
MQGHAMSSRQLHRQLGNMSFLGNRLARKQYFFVVVCLFVCLFDWLIGWLVEWLIGWLVD